MEKDLKDKGNIHFRSYIENDFPQIHQLNIQEEWNNLVQKFDDTQKAWNNSNVKIVVCINDKIIGYIRGFTDYNITLYVCELLIEKNYRGLGIGTNLLKFVHEKYPKTRMEFLGSSSSHTYYEHLNFRRFYGYRKTITEW